MKKNQEREARLDTKRRNERSSISFAFGSSTPRLLDPVEVNLVAPSGSYWGNRRSTSISNVSYGGGAMQLSRRSSERELSDGAKKRATSAGGLNRPDGEIKYVFVLFCFGILFCYFICLSFTYTTTHKKHKTLFLNEVSSFFSFTDLFHHFRLSLEQIYSHLVSFIHIYFGITCRTEKKQSITHALKNVHTI